MTSRSHQAHHRNRRTPCNEKARLQSWYVHDPYPSNELLLTSTSSISLVPAFLAFLLLITPTRSALINVTIDDHFGDSLTGFIPAYLPNDGSWHVGSPSEVCSDCHITPSTLDVSQIYDHTWHDTTYRPGQAPAEVTVNFTGSAVYVFSIVPNFLPNDTITSANISFTLDGTYSDSFVRYPDPNTEIILYNQSIYSTSGLDYGPTASS